MGKTKAVATLAAIGAAIGGVIFFWRKRQKHEDSATGGGFPPAADVPADPTA
jgi:LPXTG-motif cell wall-anchored protein